MLQSLRIQNIALIEKMEVDFHTGLQVLSGETGAGKSIVVDSVNLILGGRADRDLIRTGCEKAAVEAVFDAPGVRPVFDLLDREGIEHDGRTVSIYREMTRSGRNLCRVCGMILPLTTLRELAALLMDIHGQHDHQFLMNPARHLAYLDQIGDRDHQKLLAETGDACRAFMGIHREYARMVKQSAGKDQRIAQLEKDLNTLRKARLKAGEEEKLTEEIKRLHNAGKITESLQEAHRLIASGETEYSSLDQIRNAGNLLKGLAAYGESFEELGTRCESLFYELQELSYDIHSALENAESDPSRLQKAEERLTLIRKLQRKYGNSMEEILAAAEQMEKEYSALCALDDQMREKGTVHKQLLSAYRKKARELSESRRRLAADFAVKMEKELAELGMSTTRFSVAFEEKENQKPTMPTENGDDRVEFMISPNPGEPMKPLARIASGGELSRIMLALKTLEAGHTGIDAMVFDEIDTGISGRMAQVVAEKMMRISRKQQVICVTHLPQIAAAADNEYRIRKDVVDDRTFTTVQELDGEGRILEVARMISGAEGVTEETEKYARNLLTAAEKAREKA